MPANPLIGILPAETRKKLYFAFSALGLLLGAIQVAYGSLPGVDQPAWLTATLSVYAFIGTAAGATAASNTKTSGTSGGKPQPAAG